MGGEVLLSLEVVPLPPVIREIDRMFSFSREETDHRLYRGKIFSLVHITEADSMSLERRLLFFV